MKKTLFLIAGIVLFMTACSKEDPAITDEPATDEVVGTTVVASGKFVGRPNYPTEGTAQIQKDSEGKYYLGLQEDFMTTFATGTVSIYLSENENLDIKTASTFEEVAVIGKNGKFQFSLKNGYNTKFKNVVVWCAPFKVQFAVAKLN